MTALAKLATLYTTIFCILLIAIKSESVPAVDVVAVSVGLGVVVAICHVLMRRILR